MNAQTLFYHYPPEITPSFGRSVNRSDDSLKLERSTFEMRETVKAQFFRKEPPSTNKQYKSPECSLAFTCCIRKDMAIHILSFEQALTTSYSRRPSRREPHVSSSGSRRPNQGNITTRPAQRLAQLHYTWTIWLTNYTDLETMMRRLKVSIRA